MKTQKKIERKKLDPPERATINFLGVGYGLIPLKMGRN